MSYKSTYGRLYLYGQKTEGVGCHRCQHDGEDCSEEMCPTETRDIVFELRVVRNLRKRIIGVICRPDNGVALKINKWICKARRYTLCTNYFNHKYWGECENDGEPKYEAINRIIELPE